MKDRYSIAIGLLFLAIVVIAFLNTRGEDRATLGLEEQPLHWPLPEFAVPRATGGLEGDANVAQDDCETSQVPCPKSARRRPACRIRDAGAIRVCDLFDRPLVLSFWFDRGGDSCTDQQDAVSGAYERYRGRVNFLSLNIRDDRDEVRKLIRGRGWRMPVGYDRDGAVAGVYRVGGCPTFAYVFPGGTLQSAGIGELTVAGLSARIERLLSATHRVQGGVEGAAGTSGRAG